MREHVVVKNLGHLTLRQLQGNVVWEEGSSEPVSYVLYPYVSVIQSYTRETLIEKVEQAVRGAGFTGWIVPTLSSLMTISNGETGGTIQIFEEIPERVRNPKRLLQNRAQKIARQWKRVDSQNAVT